MFVKITNAGGYQYVRLVENYRENGKVKQRVLFNFGRLDLLKNDPAFRNIVKKLSDIVERTTTDNTEAVTIESEEDVSDAVIKNWGYIVFRKLWEELEIDKFLKERATRGRKIKFDADKVSFLMTIQRLIEPMSKLRTYHEKNRYFGFEEDIDLNQLYRCLDFLDSIKEDLETYLYQRNRDLFKMVVDIVFYEVTTIYFESCRADGLRNFGFSKDNKINEVQVVLGLLVDKEGRPIGYELFSGNTIDSKTMVKILRKLKEKFSIDKIVIVADKGLNSRLNLKIIREAGYDYIVASRLKNASKEVLEEVFEQEGYKRLDGKSYLNAEEIYGDEFKYKVLERTNVIKDEEGKEFKIEENLIITYSSKRARKDKEDRERLVSKAKELLENKGSITALEKKGARRYLKKKSKTEEYELDEEAIKKDEKFDGYYAIQTSKKDMDVEEVLGAYHDLWKIEQSFRVMKSCLEIRPIYHFTESRIKGHFVICFLAFLLQRTLEYILRKKGKEISSERIMEAIDSMNFIEIEIKGKKYLIKQRTEGGAIDILNVMKIKGPKNFMTYEEGLGFIGINK
ncbi:IS1634 family transposase [Dictyoglomus turgidum]|uniref:IS1634 family transposase n=1 Tax=Dictyoglomus turgidum TaxID=513050 RepID=UPI0023548FC0|nr:IS1634 family transposase [Dictyoglomus turgidum]